MGQLWLFFCLVMLLAGILLACTTWIGNEKDGEKKCCTAAPCRPTCRGDRWSQQNVFSDISLEADILDPDVINPWGIAVAPCGWTTHQPASSSDSALFISFDETNFRQMGRRLAWIALNGRGLLIECEISNNTCPSKMARLRSVTVPTAAIDNAGVGRPTGVVVNARQEGFHIPAVSAPPTTTTSVPAVVITVTEDGVIAAYNPEANPNAAVKMVTTPDAVYKGLALLENQLFVANFRAGHIEVYDNTFTLTKTFTDQALTAIGYAPFNVASICDQLYVAFAKLDPQNATAVATSMAGNGFIDVFDIAGNLVKRLINRGHLNAPWAMTVCSSNNLELLVGNTGDGLLHRYCRCTGRYLGLITDRCCRPITNDGIWGVACVIPCKLKNCCVCCQMPPCARPTLLLAAGINDQQDGLVAILRNTSSKTNT